MNEILAHTAVTAQSSSSILLKDATKRCFSFQVKAGNVREALQTFPRIEGKVDRIPSIWITGTKSDCHYALRGGRYTPEAHDIDGIDRERREYFGP